ncbi:MAG: ATP-binding protein, partial [Bacteroidota bacterium]|nr:ATP-binding protein [Bacteroidota bacterium]
NCNQAAEKMFGYSKEEMIGQNAAIRHIDEDSYLQFHSSVLESYSKDGHFEAEYQMRRKDGTIFPCENYVTPIYNDNGELIISVSIVRDITERKLSEERLKAQNAEIMEEIEERKKIEENLKNTLENLERTNKELGQFAYVASHDLQEPLRMVSTFTTLLERRYGNILDENAKEYMNFVVEGAKRMQMLIRELLFYSKISNKEKVVEEVDCSSVLNTAINNLNAQISESSAKILYNDLPTIKADSLLITQLFQNLISNAIKFRRNGVTPEVNICCKEEENHFLFSVKDNGIGIEPEYFGKIFVIFQRLHLRDEYPGTGIGLAICKKIVEQHGGEIWVESFIGQGSIFYFTISK